MRWWVGCLSFALAFNALAQKPKMAVPSVSAEVGVPQGTANLLGEIISADVQGSGQYDVISSADIATMLGLERAKRMLTCAEDSCLVEVGAALGADLLLRSTVGGIGNLRVISLTLIDTKRGQVKGRQTETVPDDAALVAAGHRLVAKLLDLPPPAAPGMTTRRKVGFGLLGGGAVLAGVGAAFGVAAENSFSSYQATPTNPSFSSSAQNNAHAADALYGAAVVAGAIAVYLVVTGAAEPGSAGGVP
jgi:hypothetical protein